MRKRAWTDLQLSYAITTATSYRQVLLLLSLKPAGGNYKQLQKYITEQNLSTSHFKGKGWNKGNKVSGNYRIPLDNILIDGSTYQSYKLKRRLLQQKIKKEKCEECGLAQMSTDGRIPLELDHINGRPADNRLENLRILCPNCHSLKSSHRKKISIRIYN